MPSNSASPTKPRPRPRKRAPRRPPRKRGSPTKPRPRPRKPRPSAEEARASTLAEKARLADEAKAKADAARTEQQRLADEAKTKAEETRTEKHRVADEALRQQIADKAAKADAARAKADADKAAKDAARLKAEADKAAKNTARTKTAADKTPVARAETAKARPHKTVAAAEHANPVAGVWSAAGRTAEGHVTLLLDASTAGAGAITIVGGSGRTLGRQPIRWHVEGDKLLMTGGTLRGDAIVRGDAMRWSGYAWHRVGARPVLAAKTAAHN